MDHFEYLKSGFEEAQKRFQAAQQRLQVMQLEFNTIAQEFNAWQTLYRAEAAKRGEGQQPAPTPVNNHRVRFVISAPKSTGNNQTEAIRAVLRQRPAGITPEEIWKEVSDQMKNRTYLYSVLKRLKAKGDAVERRGKYFPKSKLEGEMEIIQQ